MFLAMPAVRVHRSVPSPKRMVGMGQGGMDAAIRGTSRLFQSRLSDLFSANVRHKSTRDAKLTCGKFGQVQRKESY